MAFENLAQTMGGYSGQMLQAAIAAREQNMKERNMRLQAPLAMAKTFTGALGQWQDLEHKRNILSEQKQTNSRERQLMDLKILKETIDSKHWAEFSQLNLDERNFVLQNQKDKAPHELTELIATAAEKNRVTAYNLKMEATREAAERSDLSFAKENLIKIQNTNKRQPWDLAILDLQLKTAERGDKQAQQQYEDWKGFREEFDFPPEYAKAWEHQDELETYRKIEKAVRELDGPLDADAMVKILGDNFDINFVQSITTLLRAKTSMETKHGMQGTYASIIAGIVQKSGVQESIQDNLRLQLTTPGFGDLKDTRDKFMALGGDFVSLKGQFAKVTSALEGALKSDKNPNGMEPGADWSQFGFYVTTQLDTGTREPGENFYANWLASRKADETKDETVDTVGTVDLPTEAGGPPPLGSPSPGIMAGLGGLGPPPGNQGIYRGPQQFPVGGPQPPIPHQAPLEPQPPAPVGIPDLGFLLDIPM